jgi:hypothetical protein
MKDIGAHFGGSFLEPPRSSKRYDGHDESAIRLTRLGFLGRLRVERGEIAEDSRIIDCS